MHNTTEPAPPAGQGVAVMAEALYLSNLLLVPGLSFLALLWLHHRHRKHGAPLARCHLRQTIAGSLWAGVLLVLVNLLIIAAGGYDAPYTWMYVLTYFTVGHSSLVLLGMVGLSKAMAGQPFRYPLIGLRCDE